MWIFMISSHKYYFEIHINFQNMREVYIIIILTYKGTIAAKVQSHYYYGNKYCSSPFKQFVVKVIRLIISRSLRKFQLIALI